MTNGRVRAVALLLVLLLAIVGFTAWMNRLKPTIQTALTVGAILFGMTCLLLVIAVWRMKR